MDNYRNDTRGWVIRVWQPEIKALIDAGALKGDEKGNLNITEDMARCLIIAKRYEDRREGR